MKISDGSVAMNVPPFVSIAFSGAMTKAKICWMKVKATAQPTTTAITDMINRRRSSSRCSRNDIRPESSRDSGSVSSMDVSSSSAWPGDGRGKGTSAIKSSGLVARPSRDRIVDVERHGRLLWRPLPLE